MRPTSFYVERLVAVSRSFALCIPQLEPPFRERVALAYLLMRVLDTVEDATFANKSVQERQFERMRGFLRARPTRAELDAFVADMPPLIQTERDLLADSAILFDEAYGLPADARAVIFSAVDRMAVGMAAYARRGDVLRLVDLEDVTRYCCFVAGLVGEMLSALWTLGRAEPPPPALHAYRFGMFLQKVNILKDQRDDEAVGRFFVPDRAELLASLHDDARGALAYLQALPRDERGYRTFCAWAMMMGASTIKHLDQPKQSRRAETEKLLARTAEIVLDNAALAALFAELWPRLPTPIARPPVPKPESAEWFRSALGAPLSDDEYRQLGIFVRRVANA